MSKYLFLDDRYIGCKSNIKRTFYPWVKEKGNPVIKKKFDWEGPMGPTAAAIVPSSDGGWLMWACCTYAIPHNYPIETIYSIDRLNWTDREMTNSIDDGAQGIAVMYDNGHNFGEYKYLGMGLYRPAGKMEPMLLRPKRSKDAVHWEYFENAPVFDLSSDVLSLIWDDRRSKYVAYYKLWKLAGTTLAGDPFCAYFTGFDPKPKTDTFYAEGRAILPRRENVSVTLRYDGGLCEDGGGGSVSNAVTMIRVIARAESNDFVHWTDENVIYEPRADAPVGDQTYGMLVRRYGDMYIAMLSHFSAVSGRINAQLAWSYDGIHFDVYEDEFFLKCEPGWDSGMVLGGEIIPDLNGRMCLYYGAFSTDHRAADDTPTVTGIGRAWLRKDGFCSLENGILRTVPLLLDGHSVCFNMSGSIEVEVCDEAGKRIAAEELRGDCTEVLLQSDLSSCYGKYIILKLNLYSGTLYSIDIR